MRRISNLGLYVGLCVGRLLVPAAAAPQEEVTPVSLDSLAAATTKTDMEPQDYALNGKVPPTPVKTAGARTPPIQTVQTNAIAEATAYPERGRQVGIFIRETIDNYSQKALLNLIAEQVSTHRGFSAIAAPEIVAAFGSQEPECGKNKTCVAKVMAMVGADLMLAASLSNRGGKYVLDMSLTDPKSKQETRTASESTRRISSLGLSVELCVGRLLVPAAVAPQGEIVAVPLDHPAATAAKTDREPQEYALNGKAPPKPVETAGARTPPLQTVQASAISELVDALRARNEQRRKAQREEAVKAGAFVSGSAGPFVSDTP